MQEPVLKTKQVLRHQAATKLEVAPLRQDASFFNPLDQDELVAELLENQMRRRAQTRFGSMPHWSYW